jgi:poly(hydroxyalkanoate) depolymerase family esterase
MIAVALTLTVLVALGLAPGRVAAKTSTPDGPYKYSDSHGSRLYYLHRPSGPPRSGRPLVVYLHGCIQTALDAAAATHFGDLADRLGFVVAFPQQNVTANSSAPAADGNGAGCWNWFLDIDQHRDAGEPAVLAGLTRRVMATERIDPKRVYVAGISAGADMAVILGATYPDLFAAVGAHAGCAYATCGDVGGALAHTEMGPRARVVPMFVEQGSADTLNAYPLAQGLVTSWLATDDWADDGSPNGSVSRLPSSIDHAGLDQTPSPGSGDPCARGSNWPCPGGVIGFEDSYPTSTAHFDDARGCRILDFLIVHGMEHAQPDAPSGPFTDPLGPDLSAATYRFFAAHSMGACAR